MKTNQLPENAPSRSSERMRHLVLRLALSGLLSAMLAMPAIGQDDEQEKTDTEVTGKSRGPSNRISAGGHAETARWSKAGPAACCLAAVTSRVTFWNSAIIAVSISRAVSPNWVPI